MKRVLFILTFLLFLSCTKDQIVDPIDENEEISNVEDYFPLEVGNVWLFEYTGSQYSGDGIDYTFSKWGGTIRWEIVSYNDSIYKVLEEKIDTTRDKKYNNIFEITEIDDKTIKIVSNSVYTSNALQRFYEKNPSQNVIEYKTGDVNETKLRLGKNIGILYRYSSYSGITFGSSNRLELKKFNDIIIE